MFGERGLEDMKIRWGWAPALLLLAGGSLAYFALVMLPLSFILVRIVVKALPTVQP